LRIRKVKFVLPLVLAIIAGTIFAWNFPAKHKDSVETPGTGATIDNFDRPNGSLGSRWRNIAGGQMVISAHAAVGTNPVGVSGGMRTSGSFGNDQYSEVVVTSTQLTGDQWIGPAVRVQDAGKDAYVGIYWWNNGQPELRLYLRHAANWTPIGSVRETGPLTAGTRLRLTAVSNTISLMENGVERISASSNSLSRGAPGIMIYGKAGVGRWSGGNASGFQVSYLSSARGVKSYSVISDSNGAGSQIVRVLSPSNPAPGMAHNFLVVLRVGAGLGSSYGDGLQTLQALGAQNRYNLTIIEPTFALDPWYADNPFYSYYRYETFMTQDLVPWIKHNLATTGHEQIWLLGFSKSGLGAQDLILKHPDLFTLAASWDFPASMSSYSQYGDSTFSYGSNANFQEHYRLTADFLAAHKASFQRDSRIWIGGYALFRKDISDYSAMLTAAGIAHMTEKPSHMIHRWNSGWIGLAMAALHQESTHLR
jgi:hypothetical protein